MNFEPSLFVYFAVVLEVEGGKDLTVCCRWFEGIPIHNKETVTGLGSTATVMALLDPTETFFHKESAGSKT